MKVLETFLQCWGMVFREQSQAEHEFNARALTHHPKTSKLGPFLYKQAHTLKGSAQMKVLETFLQCGGMVFGEQSQAVHEFHQSSLTPEPHSSPKDLKFGPHKHTPPTERLA